MDSSNEAGEVDDWPLPASLGPAPQPITGTWVYRKPQPLTEHGCTPPWTEESWLSDPDGHAGDLWRCGICRTLWRIHWNTWERAPWWVRLHHRLFHHES